MVGVKGVGLFLQSRCAYAYGDSGTSVFDLPEVDSLPGLLVRIPGIMTTDFRIGVTAASSLQGRPG